MAPDGDSGDLFDYGVGMSEDYIVVGAYGDIREDIADPFF